MTVCTPRSAAAAESRGKFALSRLSTAEPPGLDAGKHLRLGVGDLLDRIEIRTVHGLHVGDHGHMGARQGGQGGDLAGMVHAHLEDTEGGITGHAGEAERQAPVIVEAF